MYCYASEEEAESQLALINELNKQAHIVENQHDEKTFVVDKNLISVFASLGEAIQIEASFKICSGLLHFVRKDDHFIFYPVQSKKTPYRFLLSPAQETALYELKTHARLKLKPLNKHWLFSSFNLKMIHNQPNFCSRTALLKKSKSP